MRQVASKALKNFRASVKLTESLLALERKYPDPAPRDLQPLTGGLRAGAAVLMVAAFEDFIRSMVREHVGSLRTRTPEARFDMLPDRIRVDSVFTSLHRALDGPEYGTKTKKVDRLPAISKVAADVIAGRVNTDAIATTGGNPGPDLLKQVLKSCDIVDAFAVVRPRFEKKWNRPVAENFIRDKLEEIVNRRHEVAHSGQPSGSREDLRTALKFLRTLAGVLDDEVRIKMNKVYRNAKPKN